MVGWGVRGGGGEGESSHGVAGSPGGGGEGESSPGGGGGVV